MIRVIIQKAATVSVRSTVVVLEHGPVWEDAPWRILVNCLVVQGYCGVWCVTVFQLTWETSRSPLNFVAVSESTTIASLQRRDDVRLLLEGL